MRILILNHYDRLSPRVQCEIQALLEAGFKVIILYWNRQKKRLNLDLNEIEINCPAPLGNISILKKLPIFYWKVIKKLQKIDFDIIHCTHLMLLPLAIILGKFKKSKIIYDAYEMHSIDFAKYSSFASGLIRKTVEFIENLLVSQCNCILTIDSINSFLAKRYKKFNKNVFVLYNVPNKVQKIDSQKLEILKRKYIGFKLLIYIGGIFEDKGLTKLLEILAIVKKRIPAIKLLMIGSFRKSNEKLLNYLEKFNLKKENVEFIPWLPYEEMFHYLKIAHVGLALHQPVGHFLLVSKGNGRKFFTYMQAGLPIVAPNFGEIGLIVKEEQCGILVDTTKPEKIAEAIIYLLEHPDEAKAMGKRGERAILEKYNWEIEKKKLLEAYKRIFR